MDAESGELFPGDGGGCVAADSWQLHAPFSCSELVFHNSEKPLQDWVVDPDCANHDSESEDMLHGVDPNEVFPSTAPADLSSESDSGISEDPAMDNPVNVVTQVTTAAVQPAAVYQVVYDISGLRSVKAEPGQENVISIELDSCIVNELPVVAAARLDGGLSVISPSSSDDSLLVPELQLTEEEQKLLTQEGISLPNNLPLTKAEERILKKVRRKIRNKQSAQDSRRRRKEYIDGLESRAAACSAQNKELQRTVEQLEKRNTSLLTQLRQLQSLIKQTVSKGAQTSTCLLIILVSLGLIIMPSFSPFRRVGISDDDDYRPIGVISRNILTDPASSQPTEDQVESAAARPDSSPPSSSPPPSLNQSGEGGTEDVSAAAAAAAAVVSKEPIETLEMSSVEVSVRDVNVSAAMSVQTEAAGKLGHDVSVKPAHADEM
ncbi:cyclic AMP-responsive element-binding protein 3-like protein 4 isoform X2 [Solea solea]|uniref:cyclic AMP-responsive element-binding protein 3-like protein 4 isoform X2 n=1 Tax=Solea solea TaxID=90069 RepID=UPI00272D2B83|nr:cyclic AMP-responsive element-binding protein 3-like protein 4 isoform X2 [Solea solea]